MRVTNGIPLVSSLSYRFTLYCIRTRKVLGFMITDESESVAAGKGNGGMNGIHDQQVALQWIKKNIGGFGGDPDRVTIGGQSSGSSSVCTHVVSPLSRALFTGAIAESGPCTVRFF
jgi:para-nitrobenzyl esterase